MKIEIPTGDWYCPECLEKRVRRGDAVVVSKRSGEEQVELSRDYVGNLIKSEEKKAQKRKLKKGKEEEEEEEEDNDEGVSFYESKRSKTIIEDEDEEAFQLDDNQSLDLSVF